MNRTIKLLARMTVVVAMLAALTTAAATAQSASRDRNHDGISDRWEKRHHLSLKVNQAGRDQDRDRVDNLCEFQGKTDPRDADDDNDGRRDGREDSDRDGVSNATETRLHNDCGDDDSDNDGVEDGDETAGKVVSFVNGVLTIAKLDGTEVSAPLAPNAEIKCEDDDDHSAPAAATATARAAHSGDDSGDDADDDSTHSGSDSNGDDSNDDSKAACGVDKLVPGALVHEAEIENGVFTEVELIVS